MKKIITFSFAMMASASMFGQTVLWNGENYDLNSKGDFWDRCNQEVVENPSKDGINTSDKCLKFTITGMNGIKVPQPKVSHAMFLTVNVSL